MNNTSKYVKPTAIIPLLTAILSYTRIYTPNINTQRPKGISVPYYDYVTLNIICRYILYTLHLVHNSITKESFYITHTIKKIDINTHTSHRNVDYVDHLRNKKNCVIKLEKSITLKDPSKLQHINNITKCQIRELGPSPTLNLPLNSVSSTIPFFKNDIHDNNIVYNHQNQVFINTPIRGMSSVLSFLAMHVAYNNPNNTHLLTADIAILDSKQNTWTMLDCIIDIYADAVFVDPTNNVINDHCIIHYIPLHPTNAIPIGSAVAVCIITSISPTTNSIANATTTNSYQFGNDVTVYLIRPSSIRHYLIHQLNLLHLDVAKIIWMLLIYNSDSI